MVSSPSFGYAVFADFGLKINGDEIKTKKKNHTKQNKTEKQQQKINITKPPVK